MNTASPSDPDRQSSPPTGRVGLWIVGARGAIASCLATGHAGLVRGVLPPVGIVTERSPLSELGFVAFEDLVLGGCDVRSTPLEQGVAELVAEHVVPGALARDVRAELEEYEERIVPGFLDAPDLEAALAGSEPPSTEVVRRSRLSPRGRVDAITDDLARFRDENRLERVVVANLASTEAARDDVATWAAPDGFESALAEGRELPASCLYARAAFESDAAFLNFTPSPGASVPALLAFAEGRALPHCGNDGKTGETLVKTALAPMFTHRALRVLSWTGYNLLGNRDGAVLADPEHKQAKVANKDQVLRTLLDGDPQSLVGIDYVPSLGDWKTAWDHVHFEGFLGARMSLQFTWSGSDSALAAPLVLDLARFLERELRLGRGGAQPHLAGFFKSPIGGATHDLHGQFQALREWAARELAAS